MKSATRCAHSAQRPPSRPADGVTASPKPLPCCSCAQHADITLVHELLLDFEPYADIEADNAKVSKLSTLSPQLKKEIVEWKDFRTSNLNRLRVTSKVANITHEHESATLLRFFGWLKQVEGVATPDLHGCV